MILIHVSDVTYVRYFTVIELRHRVCQCDTCTYILYNGVHARMTTCNTKHPNPWKRSKCTFSHERQRSCWRSYPWITAPQLTGTMSKLTESESALQSTLTKIKHCTRTLETRQIGFLIFLLLINKSEVFWLYPSKTSEIHKFLNTRSEKQSRCLKMYCLQFFLLILLLCLNLMQLVLTWNVQLD